MLYHEDFDAALYKFRVYLGKIFIQVTAVFNQLCDLKVL